MSKALSIAGVLLMAAGTATAHAQSPFSLELRGGAAIPTADLDDSSMKSGVGFELMAGYRLLPHVGLYAGWDWHRLATDEPFAGADYDVEDTGYAFGLQFRHPFTDRLGGWVRGGGIYNHIELENDDGDIVADSGHELGWEAGGGLSFAVSDRFALTPGVRYRTFSANLDVGQSDIPVDLSYLTAEIGFMWSFGGRTLAAAR